MDKNNALRYVNFNCSVDHFAYIYKKFILAFCLYEQDSDKQFMCGRRMVLVKSGSLNSNDDMELMDSDILHIISCNVFREIRTETMESWSWSWAYGFASLAF